VKRQLLHVSLIWSNKLSQARNGLSDKLVSLCLVWLLILVRRHSEITETRLSRWLLQESWIVKSESDTKHWPVWVCCLMFFALRLKFLSTLRWSLCLSNSWRRNSYWKWKLDPFNALLTLYVDSLMKMTIRVRRMYLKIIRTYFNNTLMIWCKLSLIFSKCQLIRITLLFRERLLLFWVALPMFFKITSLNTTKNSCQV